MKVQHAQKPSFTTCLLLLVLAGIIWGFGFVASKWTLLVYNPMWSNSLRFFLAGFFSVPVLIFFKSHKHKKKYWQMGAMASFLLFGGTFLQVVGLKYTSAGKSGFITSLYAVFVPLILFVSRKRNLHIQYWPLLGIAIVGILLLCNLQWDQFNTGDFYTLLSAITFALHILYLENIGKSIPNALEFNCVQSLFIGIFGTLLALATEGPPSFYQWNHYSFFANPSPYLGLFFLAFFSSLIAFSIQVYTQKIIPSHIVGPLFLLEAPFSAIFGYIFLQESLNLTNIFGAILVLISVTLITRFGQ